MTIITPGRRPTIEEIRAYYARPDILNEFLQAMQRWHVRFVPGYARQSWVYTEDLDELRALLMQPLDLMAQDSQRTEYPYFRINWARYRPAHSWDEDKLWGYDFVIEKDSFLWQACFEAMLPVMDILEYFGVYYWLKYTGHHSLHLVIPAECFPRAVGPNDVPLTEVHEALYHRLMVFLNKRARQHYNDHDRHCPPGTNMPYSVNEDTGLVNTPLRREDLATFRPWQASIYLVQTRNFWRAVPDSARGCAAGLLEAVLKPFEQQARFYPPDTITENETCPNLLTLNAEVLRLPAINSGQAALLVQHDAVEKTWQSSADVRERRLAMWHLMLNTNENDLPTLVAALADEDADTRWFAAEALAHMGPPDALPALLNMPYDDMAGACLVDFCVRHGEATMPALIEALRTFEHPWSSPPVDKALQRIGQASVPYLEALLDDANPNVRKQALLILNRIAGTPTLDSVLTMSMRHNRKHDAATMLGWYDHARVYQKLADLMQEPRNARARRNAVKSLLWVNHPDAARLYRQALGDENKKVQRWAETGIKYHGQIKRVILTGVANQAVSSR